YLGAGTKAKENAEVRRVLTPLVKLAEETGVLVLVNSHLNKGSGKALYRVLDSIAFTALGRTVHLVVRDANNPEHVKFICDKTNIGSKPLGLTYLVQKTWITAPGTGEEIETSRISWGTQHIDETADEALAEPSDSTMTNDAVEFLRIVLAPGPMKVADIGARPVRLACWVTTSNWASLSRSSRPRRFWALQHIRTVLPRDGHGDFRRFHRRPPQSHDAYLPKRGGLRRPHCLRRHPHFG